MAGSRPSLELAVEIKNADGAAWTFGPGARFAGDVPKGLRFATKRGDGFSDAAFSLQRRIDRDYVDLGLLREVTVFGTAGDTAYEGRVHGTPRSVGDGHAIAINTAGWMAHAKDRKFKETYVNRDITRWGNQSIADALTLATSGYGSNDPSSAPGVLRTGFQAPWTKPVCAAMYDANGVDIGSVYYAWNKNAAIVLPDANWSWVVYIGPDDTFQSGAGAVSTGNLAATGPGTGTLAGGAGQKYAEIILSYAAAFAGSAGSVFEIQWPCLAVYGTHGLTKRGTASATTAQGFYASDVIKNIVSRWCPKLNTAGVQDTTYLLQQIDFSDRSYPYDAFLLLNRAHRWNLSVYENRTLYFRPTDLTDYDWEVRLDDPGVTVDLQGDDIDVLANGIAVTYTDVVTGQKRSIDPDTEPLLADTNQQNPVNIAGYARWTEIEISTPVTRDEAVQFGRAALSEFNEPKAPGTIKVTGHIRDRAGRWQPVWKVRADDRIAITDHPNDRPRLIVETDYTHDDHSLSIAVDAPFARIDAVLDRVNDALSAAGLT